MAGFGSGSFGGFGQNNSQQSGGFGFGTNTNNSNPGFGGNTSNTFGANASNTSGSLFGGGNTGGGFGTSTGTFGSNSNTAFGGNKTSAFGGSTTTGGGLFGSSNSNTGTSTFGFGNNTNASSSSPFGGSGGLFGANKPAFGGTSTAAPSSLFGGTSGGGFGNSNTGAFGATNNNSIGGNVGDPPGTALAPFAPYTEKEPNSSTNQSNAFQSVLFQDPYKKWSSEELRLADYAQGRKHGNASGTGAFGVSSFGSAFGGANTTQPSGGFGSAPSGGLFGSTNNTNNTTSAFGQTGTGAFGSNATGGGLFGAKPAAATTGLFGSTTTQPAQTGGGLFGSGTGGFGSTTNTGSTFGTNAAANTGSNLFGSANANTQSKPAGGFSFGQPTTTPGFGSTTTGAFGATNPSSGGLFGSTTQSGAGGLFGGTASQPQASGSTFGSGFGTQNQPSGSLFGNNTQAKPAGGLFGNSGTTTGGGLFGNAQSTAAPFGGGTTSTATGGLFGQKPAATGTSLFGGSTTGQATGATGGLFGNVNNNASNQQPAQSSLFSSLGQNQQKPSIFGSSAQPVGGGLFGSQPGQQQPSLFGASAPPQQSQNSILGSSILGNSQGVGQAPQSLTTSIADISAYGTPSLFSNLGASEAQNPGPLATPLSNKNKARRSSILPMYKLNPASASRLMTPQKRGYGFSYSTYGTPSSPSSVASTPGGFSRNLLTASNGGRSLSKSVSTSSLRRSFNTEDSILAPGAFSASSGAKFYGSNGSVKKLVINRDMRSDLFSTPTKERPAIEPANGARKLSKKVSFDTSTNETSVPLNESSEASFPAGDPSGRTPIASKPASTSSASGDQGKGKELAIVHEEDSSAQPTVDGSSDKMLGPYWMRPSRDELDAMSRAQLQKLSGLTVGRENVGSVTFKEPVDLTSINLDELFGGYVNLQTRSATVYPDPSKKPPVGKGLNVPARISLEHSWPRVRDKKPSGDAKRLAKHIERLQRIENTSFESYDEKTGVWTFSVPHFTTYGLDYDDEETDLEGHSVRDEVAAAALDARDSRSSDISRPDVEDTFSFRRNRITLPGAFDQGLSIDDSVAQQMEESPKGISVARHETGLSQTGVLVPRDSENDVGSMIDIAGMSDIPINGNHEATEMEEDRMLAQTYEDVIVSVTQSEIPGGILRARNRALKVLDGQSATSLPEQTPWRESVKKSLSGRSLVEYDNASDGEQTPEHSRSDMRGFQTSMDLMKAIFDDGHRAEQRPTQALARPMGFVKLPLDDYEQGPGEQTGANDSDSLDRKFKAGWGPQETLVQSSVTRDPVDSSSSQVQPEAFEFIHLSKLPRKSSAGLLGNQMQATDIQLLNGVPAASLRYVPAETLYHGKDQASPASIYEKRVWQLTGILFDDITPKDGETVAMVRKSMLSTFWEELVGDATTKAMSLASTPEDMALAALAGRKKIAACTSLTNGRDFRTATLVALIGSSEEIKRDMRTQLKQWRQDSVLAEFSPTMRAIYELLGGNVCVSEGKKDGAVEDRIDSFIISKKFSLDWRQAFGLRLWYASPPDDDIATAVRMFAEDIAQDREPQPPTWYAEKGIRPLWDDPDVDKREDILWALLKIYAGIPSATESIMSPACSQLSPIEFRLPWQLSQVLLGRVPAWPVSQIASDALTLSYSAQLTAEGSWYKAAWVLAHMRDPRAKALALRNLIAQNWGVPGSLEGDMDIPEEPGMSAGTYTGAVLKKLQVPGSWVCEAMALWYHNQAERVGAVDSRHQLKLLEFYSLWLDEGTRDEAYRLFSEDLGPSCFTRRAEDFDRLLANLPATFVQTQGCRAAVEDIRSSAGKPGRSDGFRDMARAGLGRIRA